MLTEQLVSTTGPVPLRAIRRAARSKSVPRETRDRLQALVKYLETVLVRPIRAQRTGKRAIALIESRAHVIEFFGTELAALLPKLLQEDADGSLRAWLQGDTTMRPDAASGIGDRLPAHERGTLAEAWRGYLAGLRLVVQALRTRGDEAPSGAAWDRLRETSLWTDAFFLPLLLLIDDRHERPPPAILRALVNEFKTRSDARYDAAKEFASEIVSPMLDADGERFSADAADASQPDLSVTPYDLFAARGLDDG